MIILKNVLNNDEFNYSLVCIQGKIKPFCDCHEIKVVNLTSRNTITWPITIYGYFKVFCELTVGNNTIKLCCEHNSQQICLKYVLECPVNIVEVSLIICSDSDEKSLQYFLNNGISLESCKKRLILAVKLVQSFIAESLFCNGYNKRSFYMDNEIKLFKTKLTIDECLKKKEKELWHYFANEIIYSYPHKVENTKWIAFMSFTKYEVIDNKIPDCHQDVIRFTKGYSALGTNGLALLGTGNIYSFPETLNLLTDAFTDCRKVDRMILMDDSAFRGFYWSNFSTGLGTILHELSHCFGMGHSKTGIMHRGGDDINVVLSFTVDDFDCNFCKPNLRKAPSSERRDVDKLNKTKLFRFSRCKNLNHLGQCFWTENNLIMLNNHKWFTQSTESIIGTKK